jgi:hypothetical protein
MGARIVHAEWTPAAWLEDALMREVVGFIQLACALTLGMAGGWAVHQMGLVMGWSGFYLPHPEPRWAWRHRAAAGAD